MLNFCFFICVKCFTLKLCIDYAFESMQSLWWTILFMDRAKWCRVLNSVFLTWLLFWRWLFHKIVPKGAIFWFKWFLQLSILFMSSWGENVTQVKITYRHFSTGYRIFGWLSAHFPAQCRIFLIASFRTTQGLLLNDLDVIKILPFDSCQFAFLVCRCQICRKMGFSTSRNYEAIFHFIIFLSQNFRNIECYSTTYFWAWERFR